MIRQRDQDHALVQRQIVVGHLAGFRIHCVVEAEIAVQRIAFRQLAQIGRGRRRFGQQRQRRCVWRDRTSRIAARPENPRTIFAITSPAGVELGDSPQTR